MGTINKQKSDYVPILDKIYFFLSFINFSISTDTDTIQNQTRVLSHIDMFHAYQFMLRHTPHRQSQD